MTVAVGSVAVSPYLNGSSSLNAAGDEMALASTTTIIITDVDFRMHVSTNNGAAPFSPPISVTASSATVGPAAQTDNASSDTLPST